MITREELSSSLREYLDSLRLTDAQVNEIIKRFAGDKMLLKTVDKSTLVNAINELDLELDYKASKNEVFTMANMGQDIKEAMTGGSVAVVGRYSINESNIIDNSITIDKLPESFKKESGNLVKMINYDQIEGTNVSLINDTLNLSWDGGNHTFIQVSPFLLNEGETYYIHFDGKFSNNQIQLDLRNDKDELEKITVYINNDNKITQLNINKDITVNYIYVYGTDVDFNGHIWIDKKKDEHIYYRRYKSKILLEEDKEDIISTLNNISKDNLNDELLNLFYESGEYNLYNQRTITKGKAIDCLGNITDNNGFIITDYIDVEEFLRNNAYIWFKQSLDGISVSNGNAGYVAVYNNNKVNICTSHNQFYDLGYISSQDFPSGTKYIRVCFPKSYVNFGIGSHDSCLYDYYNKKELVTKKDIESIESNFNEISKKCLFYGDSITAQDLFQKIIKEKLGIDYVNCGNPGYPISNVFADNNDHGFALSNTYKMNELINLINTNQTQYLFVMGGTNDFGYDGTKVSEEGSLHAVVIGDLSYPYNRNTYKGALSNIIDRVQRECVTIEKIFIMSPIQIGEEGATDIVKNAIGLSMYDFRNACEDVANKFSCEFIDVYNSGINFINWSKYIPDKIHPNELGARLIANKIISYLKNIEHIY